MRQLLLTLSLLLVTSLLPAQDYSQIDARALAVPAPANQDIAALSKALSAGCNSEKEMARSFFIWIAENIQYDMKTRGDLGFVSGEKTEGLQTPERVVKRKMAICAGYTNLFNALCQHAGIRALEVVGLAKLEASRVSTNGHAWSLICADGTWALVDATWGAGYEDIRTGKYVKRLDNKYFFTAPELLLEDHYPHDPLFQCLPNPLTLNEFQLPPAKLQATILQKMQGDTLQGYAHISDSLSAHFPFDSTYYLRVAGKRSLQINPNSHYGCWALGTYYNRLATGYWKAYNRELDALDGKSSVPGSAWFEQQELALKQWEIQSSRSIRILKNAQGTEDGYSKEVAYMLNLAVSSLETCHRQMAQTKRYKAESQKYWALQGKLTRG
jgi:Transglutaminase-like superfamily